MQIAEDDIHRKKQELGIEPIAPSHGPEIAGNDPLVARMSAEAAESEGAELVDSQPSGTNQRNQYRYGGDRP